MDKYYQLMIDFSRQLYLFDRSLEEKVGKEKAEMTEPAAKSASPVYQLKFDFYTEKQLRKQLRLFDFGEKEK